jgi:alpha-galactosidase/6-phospho-beta-glucosidase family protein
MRISLIGAAGVRTPLLIHGLAEAAANLKFDELTFWDIDRERLGAIMRVVEVMARRCGLSARLTVT